MQMIPVRVFFEKTGRAKYTSHLDTMRTMTRSLRRSQLPLWYTQGFNPHLYMTFALPISLGYESLCESVDLRLTQPLSLEEVTNKLNDCLPPGLTVTKVTEPGMDPAEIAWADYQVTLRYNSENVDEIAQKLAVFLAQPVIQVSKRTKKGEKLVDLKPLFQLLAQDIQQNALHLTLRLATGINTNINPTLLLKAFYSWCNIEPDGVKVLRTHIYTTDLVEFQ